MIRKLLLLITVTSVGYLHCWGGTEQKGTNVTIFGTLTSNENNTFSVTKISIGRSSDASQKVTLYEKPEKPMGTSKKINMTVNPFKDLTTSELNLLKVSKIEVPEPDTSWLWRKPVDTACTSPSMAHEFIEIIITWNNTQRMSYLLELGVENTTTPLKVFCETVQEPVATKKIDTMLFCPDVKKVDLIKKGAPFPAIKQLEIKGNCYELPNNTTTVQK